MENDQNCPQNDVNSDEGILVPQLTVVNRRKAMKRSSWAAADFSNASCFLIKFSTSSIV